MAQLAENNGQRRRKLDPPITAHARLKRLLTHIRTTNTTPLHAALGYTWQTDKKYGKPGRHDILLLAGFDTYMRSFFKGMMRRLAPPTLPSWRIGCRPGVRRENEMAVAGIVVEKLRRCGVSYLAVAADGAAAFSCSEFDGIKKGI